MAQGGGVVVTGKSLTTSLSVFNYPTDRALGS
jgi:hypothetical protein